jgi:class 3 adenylate cyclase
MIDAPEIHYAKSGDVHIAYQVLGAGPLDLLAFSPEMLPIDSMDEEPLLARFNNRLASFSRLIRFDRRGIGMSDPVVPTEPTTLEQWVHDAIAVMDAVGSRRASVFAPRTTSLEAVMMAAAHPDRLASLLIVNGSARLARAEDYPIGIPQRILDRFLDINMEPDAVDRGLDLLAVAAPSVAHDEDFRAWWVRAGYRGASPATARAIEALYFRADVRPVLPLIGVPTLVLHRRDNQLRRVDHGRYLAEHIPNAKYVELEGADDLYWVGDTETMLDEIEEFVTGVRPAARSDRKLATVLFTDIVGSTQHLAEVGDRRWKDLLERHDTAVRHQLARFQGNEVKTTGDGIVATFDGPARAVACACAIGDAAAQLGLEVRAGLHTGEIDLYGNDITGLAVNIAARVAALAGPRQVLVSRTLVDLVVRSDITFADRGAHALKGVPGEWQLFSVER